LNNKVDKKADWPTYSQSEESCDYPVSYTFQNSDGSVPDTSVFTDLGTQLRIYTEDQ